MSHHLNLYYRGKLFKNIPGKEENALHPVEFKYMGIISIAVCKFRGLLKSRVQCPCCIYRQENVFRHVKQLLEHDTNNYSTIFA